MKYYSKSKAPQHYLSTFPGAHLETAIAMEHATHLQSVPKKAVHLPVPVLEGRLKNKTVRLYSLKLEAAYKYL